VSFICARPRPIAGERSSTPKAADPRRAALLDSLYVETIQTCERAPADVAAEMVQDGFGWPGRLL
jgi:hypothetical protein